MLALEESPARTPRPSRLLRRAVPAQLLGIFGAQLATLALVACERRAEAWAWACAWAWAAAGALDEAKLQLLAAQFCAVALTLRLHLRRANRLLQATEGREGREGRVRAVRAVVRFRERVAALAARAHALFGLPLLLLAACVFLALTAGLYVILSCHVGNVRCEAPLVRVRYGVWCVSEAAVLTAVAVAAAACSAEAKQTSIILHKILLNVKNVEMKEELEVFSLQLSHQPVEFTAWGFFPIDYSLLYTIVGAVTTYLVILLQFQISFDISKKATNSTLLTNVTRCDRFDNFTR